MKKLVIALAAIATLGFAAPSFARDAADASSIRVAQADVKVRVSSGRHGHVTRKVIVRRDRGHHAGWRHAHRHGTKVVIVKKRPHKTVRKVIIRR